VLKTGLPFLGPSPLINTHLNGIISRAQRDNTVTLCHYLWMSNQIYIILAERMKNPGSATIIPTINFLILGYICCCLKNKKVFIKGLKYFYKVTIT
jgi:hypothetical protein